MKLFFINNQKPELNCDKFEILLNRAKECFEALNREDLKLNLIIIDDEEIQGLNKQYRNRNKPTDVLSFTYIDLNDQKDVVNEDCVGEIFISMETAIRQAGEKGHSLEKEMEILFVHGLLHILGFDHQNDREEEEMEMWAKKILE